MTCSDRCNPLPSAPAGFARCGPDTGRAILFADKQIDASQLTAGRLITPVSPRAWVACPAATKPRSGMTPPTPRWSARGNSGRRSCRWQRPRIQESLRSPSRRWICISSMPRPTAVTSTAKRSLACEEVWNYGHTAKTEDLEVKGRGALRQAATWLQKIFTFVRPYRVPKTRYAPVRHWCASLIARPPAPPPLALLFWRAVASVPLSLAADCSPNGPRPSPKEAARLTFSVRLLVA